MLALLLLKYEIRMAQEGIRPSDDWFGPASMPSRSAEVLFRPRGQAS